MQSGYFDVSQTPNPVLTAVPMAAVARERTLGANVVAGIASTPSTSCVVASYRKLELIVTLWYPSATWRVLASDEVEVMPSTWMVPGCLGRVTWMVTKGMTTCHEW